MTTQTQLRSNTEAERLADALGCLDHIGMSKAAQLKGALEEVEIAWHAAELAIANGQQAADKAYKLCYEVRCGWKREEGTDILRLLEIANTVAVHAKYRADAAAKRNSYGTEQIESGFKKFRDTEAAHGITSGEATKKGNT
jgi:CRISPR/Cas system-associated endonuclease Cas3-HD